MMDYDMYIEKLIEYTKSNTIQWDSVPFPAQNNFCSTAYYVINNSSCLVIQTYQGDSWEEIYETKGKLAICDRDFKIKSEIYEDELQDSTLLIRLYRLAQRNANRADVILSNFFNDLV